jgi:hypothetical protein
MGWLSDLWEGIKAPFRWTYDRVINPAFNWVSNAYDKVKGYLPAPIRTIGDTIQNTGKQVQTGVQTGRDALTAVGLKHGGMVMPEKNKFQA